LKLVAQALHVKYNVEQDGPVCHITLRVGCSKVIAQVCVPEYS
jgi:hypothetical protein